MIIEQLRAKTQQSHEELEKAMFPFIQQIKTVEEYAALLRVFYGYYAPLEKGIDQYLDQSRLDDYASRRKVSWIIDDLNIIGQSSKDISLDPAAPVIDSNAAAIGALYVMEGSTLGGKVICKTIGENLGMEDRQGLSFFYGYGPEAAPKWKRFMEVLNSYTDQPEAPIIIQKADEVFKQFKEFLHTSYLSQIKQ